MTIQDAKAIAQEWVEGQVESIPNFAGAFLVGSVVEKEDTAPFPATFDVDIRIVTDGPIPRLFLDPAAALAQRKPVHRGVILEPICTPLSGLRDAGKVAGSHFAAAAFRKPNVVLDPTGILIPLQRDVSLLYAKERCVRARCDSAAKASMSNCDMIITGMDRLPGCASELIQKVGFFYLGALCLAVQIPCLADRKDITFRKSFVAARKPYQEHGAPDLYRGLLDLSGGAAMDGFEARDLLEEYARAFDFAIRIVKTPFWGNFDLQEISRPVVIGGATELVQAGFHREAMLFMATMRSWMQNAIENDAPQGEKEEYRAGYARFLSSIGIGSTADIVGKAEELKRLLPEIMALAERIIAANPAIGRE